ncbi:VENN motif pre-toxin domain-containing protein [Pantoea agglomerans]|uniref:VENN motif pre-toxin domain-containing protein n=1 Tax=Enterobacter agglomerans TaxID=549 RepID=UPI00045C5C77|nr:VENN motif pre-toxin domain-containing protein [Pantoea agglomerans]KDA93498.1 hypothetical protein T296_17455 [Pantoea agglomerans Eh318]
MLQREEKIRPDRQLFYLSRDGRADGQSYPQFNVSRQAGQRTDAGTKAGFSALGQLAAQLSAGVASGSVEGGIQGAVAGKNAVENNTLGNDEEELQREHGNRPVKIISIKPAQAGIVDDEGSIRSVWGKVILPFAIKDLPATTGKAGTSSESVKDAKVVEPYITTSPIAVSGTRAIDKA